jgi:hypothetical protein
VNVTAKDDADDDPLESLAVRHDPERDRDGRHSLAGRAGKSAA